MNGVDLPEELSLSSGGGYTVAYETLYEAKSITCSVTGTTFDAVPAPCAVILDVSLQMYYSRQQYQQLMIVSFYFILLQFFAFPQLQATRAVSGRSVPIIACSSYGAGAMIRLFGPESMGGAGDIGAKIDAEVTRTGQSADEIGPKVYISYSEGELIRIPGLPGMYDHEFYPQKVWHI
jgi:hypothetical protein